MAGRAWRTYAAGSEVDHFARFCREHLIQSEDRWEGQPLKLEPSQEEQMATISINTRTTGTGQRYDVRYRMGGRTYPIVRAGPFKT